MRNQIGHQAWCNIKDHIKDQVRYQIWDEVSKNTWLTWVGMDIGE